MTCLEWILLKIIYSETLGKQGLSSFTLLTCLAKYADSFPGPDLHSEMELTPGKFRDIVVGSLASQIHHLLAV